MCEARGYLKYVFIFKICIHLSISDNVIQNMTNDKSQEVVSGDFRRFLQTLGSMVYKSKKVGIFEDTRRRNDYSPTPPTSSRSLWRNDNDDHRDAFQDMLMLKLVSYYENKYKVSHAELVTNTPSVPVLEDTTPKKRKLKPIERLDLDYQNNRNYRFQKNNDVPEVVVI